MLRPGISLLLWLAAATLLLLNNMIGDTLIATEVGPRLAAWYKVLVPLPYVAWLAALHARHTAGPQWRAAAAVAACGWPPSTALFDAAYGRLTYGEDWVDLADRYGVQWGAPFPWLLLAQAVLPLLFGWLTAQTRRGDAAK